MEQPKSKFRELMQRKRIAEWVEWIIRTFYTHPKYWKELDEAPWGVGNSQRI